MKIIKLILILALASASAYATENNASQLNLAREVIEASQVNKMFDNMGPQLKQLVLQQNPVPTKATAEQRKEQVELIGKVLDFAMNEYKGLMAELAAVYADIYTEAELQAMLTFFSSPEGKSMLAKQPQVMAKVIPIAQEMNNGVMSMVMKEIEEAKARNAQAQ